MVRQLLWRTTCQGEEPYNICRTCAGGLEKKATPIETVRWVPPHMNIVLRPWQVRLVGILNEPPVVRRILWVSGPPSCGQTTMTRYLEQEYEGGICSFEPCVEMAGCLQAYRGQAQVILAFPL